MKHAVLYTLAIVAVFAFGIAGADDLKTKAGRDRQHGKATITKVDSNASTVTVTMKDKNGKETEKTIPLTLGAAYLDRDGKSAKLDSFQPGNHVRFIVEDGKILEMKKCLEHIHGTISTVDAKKGSVAVTVKGPDGKNVEKTFEVANGTKYLDDHGNTTTLDSFKPQDSVRITKKDGKIAELKECATQAQAIITKVNAEKGQITVAMKDPDGKKTEKVFNLIEEAEYVDSSGEVAVVDVFRSGDQVLIIESDGQLSELKQDPNQSSKGKTSGDKSSTKEDGKTTAR